MTTLSIRDVDLFVKVIGRGYPLALMHGGPGQDHTVMLPLRACADRYTLVFYDQRANGRSDGVDVTTMTWDNLTADAEALRRALGFEKWAVLGYSFGGMVALEYALRYPDSLSHLVLMDACGDAWWAQKNAPRVLAERGFSAGTVRTAERFFNGQITPDEFMPAVMKLSRAYYSNLTLRQLARDFPVGLRMAARPEALIFGFGTLLKGWSVMERLGEIQVPTLVMGGRDDFQFPPEHQAQLAAGIANARLEIIERAGHNALSEQTDAVLAALNEFLPDTRPGIGNKEPDMSEAASVPPIVNRTMKFLLRTPLHGVVSKSVCLITFTGRKSGKTYTTPVSYSREGDVVNIFTHANWWKNFAGGEPVTLCLRGQEVRGTPQVTATDKQAVAEGLAAHLRRVPSDARYYDVSFDEQNNPRKDEVERAAETAVMVRVQLDAAPPA